MSYRRKLSYLELSVINRASTIIASSLDVPKVFDRFVAELRKIVDIDWAAVALAENDELHFLTVFSAPGSSWKVPDRMSIKGTATEWVILHKKPLVEADVLKETQFVSAVPYRQQGIHSVANLPLIAKTRAIGSLIIASCQPDAYGPKETGFLKQVATQITLPIENSKLYAEMKELARIDDLTGLFNRRAFDEVMINEINRQIRYGGVFSLIILDLDSFKTFNDKSGHLAGDDVLRKIGSAIKNSIRSADQAFRYGGDEFAIILPTTGTDAALLVAERIRKKIASRLAAVHIPVTASLGLATWPVNGTTANNIVAAADTALYLAKQNGRNRCQRA